MLGESVPCRYLEPFNQRLRNRYLAGICSRPYYTVKSKLYDCGAMYAPCRLAFGAVCLRRGTFLSPNKKVPKEVGLGGGVESLLPQSKPPSP